MNTDPHPAPRTDDDTNAVIDDAVTCTWDDIARLLGTSRHEAELRFDPESPVADRRWPFDTD